MFVPRLSEAVLRLRRISEKGTLQLAIDIDSIRRILLDFPKVTATAAPMPRVCGCRDGCPLTLPAAKTHFFGPCETCFLLLGLRGLKLLQHTGACSAHSIHRRNIVKAGSEHLLPALHLLPCMVQVARGDAYSEDDADVGPNSSYAHYVEREMGSVINVVKVCAHGTGKRAHMSARAGRTEGVKLAGMHGVLAHNERHSCCCISMLLRLQCATELHSWLHMAPRSFFLRRPAWPDHHPCAAAPLLPPLRAALPAGAAVQGGEPGGHLPAAHARARAEPHGVQPHLRDEGVTRRAALPCPAPPCPGRPLPLAACHPQSLT